MEIPNFGQCGDQIGFHGCHRASMNTHIEDVTGPEFILPEAERKDDQQLSNFGHGNKQVKDEINFHLILRKMIDDMIARAKKCDTKCCKTVNIRLYAPNPEIREWISNNALKHYSVDEAYIHRDVVKKTNFLHYILEGEEIKINCEK